MLKFNKKAVHVPTAAEREAEAEDLSTGALSMFEDAARDLELSGALHEELSLDAYDEADRLVRQAERNRVAAHVRRKNATHLRELFH